MPTTPMNFPSDMIPLSNEDINTLIETQLSAWPESKRNYDRLIEASRRPLPLGDLGAAAQCNPARIRSTAAAVDKESVAARPCFICTANRPQDQITLDWDSDWHLLVNPYPILPVHFTIVSKRHEPQGAVPIEMAAMAEAAPDLAIFFNGAKAGASAPDHRHCQAVLKSELPLISVVERYHPIDRAGWMSSEEYGADIPFAFLSAVIEPTPEGMRALAACAKACGYNPEARVSDPDMVNAFFWISQRGLLRIALIPRKAHRPSHYFRENDRIMVSPGAIDMAGILILPRREDFDRITEATAKEIYEETAFKRLPAEVAAPFLA